MKVYLDASIFIFPVISKSSKASAAKEILLKVEEGDISAVTSALTLDEVVWVIWRERDKETGIAAGKDMLRFPGLDIVPPRREILSSALRLMNKFELRPRDAIHSATVKNRRLEVVLSDDRDFDKIEWIKRYPIEKFVRSL